MGGVETFREVVNRETLALAELDDVVEGLAVHCSIYGLIDDLDALKDALHRQCSKRQGRTCTSTRP